MSSDNAERYPAETLLVNKSHAKGAASLPLVVLIC